MLSSIIYVLARARSILRVAVQRVIAQRGLALATIVGLTATIALTLSIPIYAEGVYYRMLTEGLFSDTPQYRGEAGRPPISLLFRYIGSFTGPRQWEEMVPLNVYFEEEVYRYLRLPPSPKASGARLFNTGLFGFFPERDADVLTEKSPEFQVGLAAMQHPAEHLHLIDGTLPSETAAPDGTFEILVSRFLAEKMGIQVGEIYLAYDLRAQRRYEDDPARFEMRVTGVWEPADPDAEYWEYSQLPVDNMLFVSEGVFAQRLAPALSDEIYQALWYLPMDAEKIYVDDVEPLLLRIKFLQQGVVDFLPNTTLDLSPTKVLERYQEAANVLTLLLFAFSVPVISLILTFVVLVVALNVERQHSQVAMLRSRGATALQVLGIAAVESGLLGVLALIAALPLSMVIARAIGQTRSFLDFSIASDLRVGLTWGTVRFGVAAVALALVVQVVPMLSSARHTVVTYKTERARRLRPPWWQRLGLDFLLMAPAVYGAYLLNLQGTILANAEEIPTDPFQNPLLFLVPALSLLAATLLVLRVMPLLMRVLAWVAGLTKNVGSLMAVRQLARAPGLYAAPLALLILTLGLSTYSASLAATLDNHLHDQHHYWVGADVSLVDTGDSINAASDSEMGDSAASDALRWRFLPVSEYLSLHHVEDAGRVGRYEARVQTAEGFRPGTYLGVDRTDFADVAFWRDDFADESLGGLMNLLALRSDAILLPQDFMIAHLLNVGDTIQVAVRAYDQQTTMPATIVGSFDYFPSWYPDTGPLAVGNLDYFFQEAQMHYPYRVWLDADPAVDFEQFEDELWELNFGAQAMVASRLRILEAQRQPQRQGLLGLLSVGFGAASVLTALGFVLYTLFSFRRRSVEIGVLRAVGLSKPQMIALVASELAILLVLGAAAGTGLGIWASNAFVPALQIGAEMTARVPPFVVEIAWPALFRIYALFALLFLVALAVLIRLLMRMKLFQAIKLGETI